MIYVLTIRNKSGLPVLYKGTPFNKLVLEFVASDSGAAGSAVRDILLECSSGDPHHDRLLQDALEDTWSGEYYNDDKGLQVDWKSV